MKNRKYLLLFLALILMFTICSCKSNKQNQPETTTTATDTTAVVSGTTEPVVTTEPDVTTAVVTTTEPVVTTTPVETTTATTPVETTTQPVVTTSTPVETTVPVETTTTTPVETTAPVVTTETSVETTAPAETTAPVVEHTHKYTWKVVKEATCTEEGTKRGTCSCGDKKTRSIAATGHSYTNEQVTVEPTCETTGTKISTCHCGDVKTEEIPATGHSEVLIPEIPATCTTPGKTSGSYCSVCETVFKAVEDVPASHKPVIDPAVAATCTSTGLTEGRHCEACGEIFVAQTVTPAIAHEYTNYVSNGDATCTADGTKTAKCDHCDATNTVADVDSKLGHDVDATVWEKNSAGHYHVCARCSTMLDFAAHDADTCTVCGYVKPAEPCTHKLSKVEAKAATCTVVGNLEYYVCDNCHAWFSDAEGTVAIADLNSIVVPAAHTKVVEDAAVEATCTSAGKTAGSHCEDCGKVIVAQTATELKAHTEVIDEAKDATCTETGLTAGAHCSVCEAVLIAQKTVAAKGHTEVIIQKETPATCTSVGATAKIVCSTCENVIQESTEIPMLAHTVVTDAAVAATCVTEGKTEGSHCSVCNEILVAQKSVPATGEHEYVKGEVVAPTCTEAGYTPYKCKNCDDFYKTDSKAAAGHKVADNAAWTVDTDNLKLVEGTTCEYEATKTAPCSVCGETVTDKHIEIKHSYKEALTTAPTCQTKGVKTFTCENDSSHTYTVDVDVDPNAHIWSDTVDGKQTCTVDGCTSSKVVLNNYSDSTSAGLTSSTIESAAGNDLEVKLKDATIQMDSEIVNGLKEQGEVNLSADKLDETTRNEVVDKLDDTTKELLAGKPIYNFTLTKGEGEKTENIDFNGTMTITLPYTLGENEDPNSIAICYIDDEGKIELIRATYAKGFITFTTTHFSTYAPVTVSGEDLCELRGEHQYHAVIVNNSCLTDGYTYYLCDYCNDDMDHEKFDITPAKGHTDEAVVTPATCTSQGYTTYTCTDCGYQHVSDYTEMVDHSFETVTVAPTCTTEGYTAQTCASCGFAKKSEFVDALGHEWGTATVTKEASCKEHGIMSAACLRDGCDATKTSNIPMLDHTLKAIAGVAPTCTESGMTQSVICSVCEEVLVASTEIAALGHNEQIIAKIDPTCTTVGYTEGSKCSVCNEILVAPELIPALGHSYGDDKICDVCGVKRNTLLYAQTFDMEDCDDTETVLNTIGWNQLTVEKDAAPSQTNAKFEIKDGKLYFYNYGSDYLGKDGYWEIASLSRDYMKAIFKDTYSLQYDITYTSASKGDRYANILTEYSMDGLYYNTVHFRISGYGNSQAWNGTTWLPYDVEDENDLFAATNDDTNENGYTSICKKLLGQNIDTSAKTFTDITVTIRVVNDSEKGPSVYMKTADMTEFILVSQYSADSKAAQADLWKSVAGTAAVFKIGTKINGWIDNIYLWADDGEIPAEHEHTWSEWTTVSEADCIHKGVEQRTCDGCDMIDSRLTDAVGHNYVDGVCENCKGEYYSTGLAYTRLTDGSFSVSGIGTCTDTDIIIPAVLPNGEKVTTIANGAFNANTTITSVVIPEGVISIGNNAFKGCTALTALSLPDTLEYVGYTAFTNAALTYTNDEYATYLGSESNPYMILVDVTDHTITDFTFKSGTKIIAESAFSDCDGLTAMAFPEGITGIGYKVFNGCDKLTTVTIPASTRHLIYWTFYGANALTSVEVAEGNPVYHSETNCIIETATKTVITSCGAAEIPADGSVEILGTNSLFATTTKHVVIPDGVVTINSYAFQSAKVQTVYIPSTVTTIGTRSFVNSALTTIYYGGSEEEWANIVIDSDNAELLAAEVLYNSCNHDVASWSVTAEATCKVSGSKAGLCSKCEQTVTVTIPKLSHVYGDDTVCDLCGFNSYRVVYSETFDMENCDDTETVLNALGYVKDTVANGAYSESDVEFAIVDGRLYYDNYDETGTGTRVTTKDAYYRILGLSDEIMKEVVAGKYTLQYDLEYVLSKNASRYAAIITEYSEDGLCYNTFHFRVGGYGNHQCHFYGSWKTFSAYDPATDLNPASMTNDGSTGTPLIKKLLGAEYNYNSTVAAFLNIAVTVKIQWEPEVGHHVYMKTAAMDDFVKVSEPHPDADGINYLGWDGYAAALKVSANIDGYIDNIYLWTTWGEMPTEHTHEWGEWTTVTAATCTENGTQVRTCSGCDMTDWQAVAALGHTYTNWTGKDATCLEEGRRSSACDVCHTTVTESIAKLTHVWGEDGMCSHGCGTEKYSEGLAYTTLSDGTLSVSGIGTCTDTEIIIPAKLDGVAVTQIAASAFYKNTTITSVVIPEGVTVIGNYAFEYCTGLVSVTVPSTVATWGEYTFAYDTALVKVDLAEGLTGLGGRVFYGCKALETVALPNSLTSIGESAFYNCTGLTSIAIPEGVTSIGSFALYGCTALTKVELPSTLVSVGNNVFANVSTSALYLTKDDENKAIYLGNESNPYLILFDVSDTSVTSMKLNDSVKILYYYSLSGCKNLTELVLPEGLLEIGYWTFGNCINLKELVIPSSVINIRENALGYNKALTSLQVAEGNTVYYSVDNCVIERATNTLVIGIANSVIPTDGSVTAIANYAFAYNSMLTEISIPASITKINTHLFEYCQNLTSIQVDAENTVYYSEGNCIIEKDSGKLVIGCTGSVIPSNVTSIGTYAFYGSAISEVVVPDNVTSIGTYAFANCSSLTDVTIGSGVKSINNYVFQNSAIETITIPASVTSIGNSAFYGCNSLVRVYYGGMLEQWNSIKIGTKNDSLNNAKIISSDAEFLDLVEALVDDLNALKGRLNPVGTDSDAADIYWALKGAEVSQMASTAEQKGYINSVYYENIPQFEAMIGEIEDAIEVLGAIAIADFQETQVNVKVPASNQYGSKNQKKNLYYISADMKATVEAAELTENDLLEDLAKISNSNLSSTYLTVTVTDYPLTYTWSAEEQACQYAYQVYSSVFSQVHLGIQDITGSIDDAVNAITGTASYKNILNNVSSNETLLAEVAAFAETYVNYILNTDSKLSNAYNTTAWVTAVIKSDYLGATHVNVKSNGLSNASNYEVDGILPEMNLRIDTFNAKFYTDDTMIDSNIVYLWSYKKFAVDYITESIANYKNTYKTDENGTTTVVANMNGYAYDMDGKTELGTSYESELDNLLSAYTDKIMAVTLTTRTTVKNYLGDTILKSVSANAVSIDSAKATVNAYVVDLLGYEFAATNDFVSGVMVLYESTDWSLDDICVYANADSQVFNLYKTNYLQSYVTVALAPLA